MRNFAELGALHIICDADPDTLEELALRYPGANAERSYQQVLANNEIEGVVIASPAALHYSMAKEALLAGKDVFVEKPFTTNARDAGELVQLAHDDHRILMSGHLLLYHPAVQMLKQYIQSGELGDIYYLYSTRVNLGQIRRDESALWRLVPHDIAVFLYLLDSSPVPVSAHGSCYLQPHLEDVVFATLEFPGGILAHIHASWLDPHKTRQLTVVGSEKMAIFDDMEPQFKLQIHDKGAANDTLLTRSSGQSSPPLAHSEPLLLECQQFVHCMEDRSKPLSDGKLGLEVVQTLEALQHLLEAGRQ